MINIIWAILVTIVMIMVIGATIMESKKDKAFRKDIKELNYERLELIREIEITMMSKRSK